MIKEPRCLESDCEFASSSRKKPPREIKYSAKRNYHLIIVLLPFWLFLAEDGKSISIREEQKANLGTGNFGDIRLYGLRFSMGCHSDLWLLRRLIDIYQRTRYDARSRNGEDFRRLYINYWTGGCTGLDDRTTQNPILSFLERRGILYDVLGTAHTRAETSGLDLSFSLLPCSFSLVLRIRGVSTRDYMLREEVLVKKFRGVALGFGAWARGGRVEIFDQLWADILIASISGFFCTTSLSLFYPLGFRSFLCLQIARHYSEGLFR
ncbi:hypothetical protein V8C44DRAFT_272050 [Trichoderma aethiopicum]